jgi:fatty-acid desaturase
MTTNDTPSTQTAHRSRFRQFRDLFNKGPVILGYIVAFHVLAVLAFTQPFHWHYLPVMALFYVWMGLSTGLYLHRYLAHRSFEMAMPLQFLFALGSALTFMRSPFWWAGQHRVHHQKSDQPGDVHSPRDGFWHAYVGWVLKSGDRTMEFVRAGHGIKQTRFTRVLGASDVQILLNTALCSGLYAIWGLGGALWCLYVPLVLSLNMTWCVNTFCHIAGYRNFDTPDNSRNSFLLGILTFGEGFHNNHHAKPQLARAGMRWFELDFIAWLIGCFERLGWAWDVRWSLPTREQPALDQAG